MASGDEILKRIADWVPDADAAHTYARPSGNTPGIVFRGYAFPSSADKYMDYLCRVQNYAGGTVDFMWEWMSASVSGGSTNMNMSVSILKFEDDVDDADANLTFDTSDNGSDSPASASGEHSVLTIAKVNANMDGLVNDDLCIVRWMRDVSVGSNMTGDCQCVTWTAREQ